MCPLHRLFGFVKFDVAIGPHNRNTKKRSSELDGEIMVTAQFVLHVSLTVVSGVMLQVVSQITELTISILIRK